MLALLPAQAAEAQALSSVPAAFVDVGVGARSAALGHAGVAGTSGLESVTWNAASSTAIQGVEASFVYLDQLGLIGFGEAAIGWSMGARWGVGLSVRDAGDDALRETSMRVTLGRRVGRLSFGASGALHMATFGRNDLAGRDYSVFDPEEIATGLSQQVSGDARGIAVDFGVQYRSGRAAAGVTVRNASAPIAWSSSAPAGGARGSYTEHLPVEIVAGIQVPAGSAGLLLMDFRPALDTEMDSALRVGVEWVLADLLALRAGTARSLNGRDDESYSAGFGLLPPKTGPIRLEAAYAYGTSLLGVSQQLSLTLFSR